jgi:hypothetical protein
MIDVSAHGANHVQLMHVAGLSAHSMLLTRNEALDLAEKLRKVLDERSQVEEFVPDN